MNGLPGDNVTSTILVVDDNQTVTCALSRLLQKEGYETAVCHNGTEALAYTTQQLPAAAVVDIHLPDVSGLVLTSKLRERFGPTRPIIIVSGDTSIENLKSLSHVGATYFISKPFKGEVLVERLSALGVGGNEVGNDEVQMPLK